MLYPNPSMSSVLGLLYMLSMRRVPETYKGWSWRSFSSNGSEKKIHMVGTPKSMQFWAKLSAASGNCLRNLDDELKQATLE